MSNFATRLKIALNQRGIKQSVLAYKCGVDQSTISNYLKGRYEPKNDMLVKLGTALGVDPAWLAGYDVPMNPAEQTTSIFDNLSEADKKLIKALNKLPENEKEIIVDLIQSRIEKAGL